MIWIQDKGEQVREGGLVGSPWLRVAVVTLVYLLAVGCQAAPPQAIPSPTATLAPAIPTPTAVPPTATQPPAIPTPTAVPPTATPPPPATSTPTATQPPAVLTPTLQAPTPAPAQPTGGDPARGQQLFTTNCSACHPGGRQGLGPVLVGVTSRLSEAEITQIVRQGREGMPPIGAAFTQQQVADLLAYLKTLQ